MSSTTAASRSGASERKFGLSVGGMLLLGAGIASWRGHVTLGSVLAAIGALLILAALFAPGRLTRVELRWMAFAAALGAFNTRVILTLCYYLVITPVGIVMRVARHDPLDRSLRTSASYWRLRSPEPTTSVERYMRQS